jgi:hypothetical protein
LSKLGLEENGDIKASKFLVSSLNEDPKVAIHIGRTLIQNGLEVPSVHEKMIELSVREGHADAAEKLHREACERWPDQEEDFTYALGALKA